MKPEKIYNVIGSSFKGVMVFKYNLSGVLTSFELQDADEFDDQQINWLFRKMFPYKETGIGNFKATQNFTVLEGEFKLTFEMFWDAYKYPVKKVYSRRVWDKLSDDDKIRAIASIRNYNAFLFRKRGQDKAYPSTYLAQRYWEDEFGSAS